MTEATAILKRCRQSPEWFIREVLGWTPTKAALAAGYTSPITPDQQRVAASVRDYRRTAVPAGHGVGKTKIAAALALWFLFCWPGSKVVTTAPGAFQVEMLLWKEIRGAYNNAKIPLGGRILQTELQLSDDWFAIGLSPQKGSEEDTAVRFSGFHAPRLMVILDEATGVHISIWGASEGLAVGPYDRFLAIGNPTDPTSHFKEACESPLWHVERLSSANHPNVVHNNPNIIPGAVTKEWVDERLDEYGGEESAGARARIFGLWPEQGSNMLISLAWVEAAQARWAPPAGKPDLIVCDVARFGSDETVIMPLHGTTLGEAITHQGQNLMQTTGELIALAQGGRIVVDDTGLGGGVTDRLQEQGHDVLAVNFGEGATDNTKFINRRGEMYWALREALRLGTHALPPDKKLAADLTNLKYSFDSASRIVLEKKEDFRKRMKRSPDRGDTAAMAVWAPTTGPSQGIFF